MKQLLLPITLFLLLAQAVYAQEPPDQCPGGNLILASTCQDACVLCDINGLIGNNGITDLGMAPPGFCAPQLHNTQWVGFVAGTANIQMEITPFNCQNANGLQIGIYNTLDCTAFSLVSECYADIPPNTVATFNMSSLQVGGIYFIVIDGSNAGICDFSVDVIMGSTVAPTVNGAATFPMPPGNPFCVGQTVNVNATNVPFASIYTWTLNGNEVAYTPSAGIVIPPGTPSGPATLCVTPSNPCSQGAPFCRTINITPPDQIPASATICDGEVYMFQGQSFFAGGTYMVNATGADGCLDIYTLNLTVDTPDDMNVSPVICQGEVYWVGPPNAPGSVALTAAGFYSVTLPRVGGNCANTVNVTLGVNAPEFVLVREEICQGESVTVEGQSFTATGQYDIYGLTDEGCQKHTVLVLQVYPVPGPRNIAATICNGANYENGEIFLSAPNSGTYQFILESVGGCDSVVNLSLTERNVITTPLVQTVCAGQSVTVGGTVYSTTGMYTRTLVSPSTGCDSTVNLNLTVLPAIGSTQAATICQGESYMFGSTSYTTAGSYQQVFPAAGGCDSTVTLNLTVRPNRFTTLSPTICSDETYSVGSSTYNATGTYSDTLLAANGCDSIITLNLTVRAPITGIANVSICEDETYTLGGMTFDMTGTYPVTLVAASGCDSVVTLNLTVLTIPQTTFTESICQGETFTFNGNPYTTSGTYVETFLATTGCDSIVTLNLTVIQPVMTTLNIGICTGQTYSVGGNTYDSPGTYVNNLMATNSGCDSIVTLNLTVNDILEGFGSAQICDGETYTVGGMNFTTTGMYDLPSVTPSGCDSVFHLNLTVHPLPMTDLVITICDDETYTVGSSTYNMTGVYQNTLTSSVTGCDSIVNLNLTVLNTPEVTLDISICDGETYTVGSTAYDMTGSYQQTFTAANGCDSTVFLNLTVLNVPVTDLVESICDGETYTVGNSNYTLSGVYQDVLVAANGCDSIVNLNLTVLDVPETMLTELICAGEIYSVGTSSYTVSGMYQDVLVAANGCDSIVRLNLTVAPNPVTNITTSICDGATYNVGSSSYTMTGMYRDTLVSALGCDSIVNLNLTITSFYQVDLVETVCEGETYTVGTTVYDETGMYTNMFIAQDGCDSFVNLNLTVLNVPITDLVETICDGETYTVGNSNYTLSGIYQDILVAANGCDSIVNLNLTVNPVFTTNLTEFICDGETFTVGNSNYTVSGVYQDVLMASNGCDSTVNLNLTVYPIPVTNLTEIVCFGDTYTVGSSTYSASGTYQDVLVAATGCDSIVNLNLTVRALIETNLTEVICAGDSYTVGSSTYNATGMYQDVLTATNGCDSIVNLDLTVRIFIETNLTETICEGETYTVGTSNYTTSGIYQDVLTSVSTGCDSTVNLNLTVTPTQFTTLTEEICDGETFTVGTSNYTTSGTYQDMLQSVAGGCDSIVTLNLTVHPIPQTNLVRSICDGETFMVGGSTYATTGTYQDVLTSTVTGCDSIVNLNLTVIPIPVTTLTREICDGETFTVGNSTYNTSGQYQDILVSASSCDSIVNLNLTVNPVFSTTLTELICDDETFMVGNSSFNTTGTFMVPLQSVEGCDSLVTLNLTTHPCQLSFNTLSNPALCNGSANGSYRFSVTIGTAPYTYSWQGVGNPLTGNGNIAGNNTDAFINNLPAGNYRITVTDSYGIVGMINFTIGQPPVLNTTIALSDYEGFNVSCAGDTDGTAAVATIGGTAPYNYAWSNGSTNASIEGLQAGTYTVSVTDNNGCISTAQATLNAPQPLSVAAEVTDPLCFGDNAGFINVTTATGGVGPFVYAIGNQPFTVSPVFGNLGIGDYNIRVQDANGCETTITATVNQPQELIVDLGPDVRIGLGDSISLPANTSYPVASYAWKNDPALSCTDCYEPTVRPFETIAFSVLVTDENGCTDTDAITIFVAKNREVFIPNVFSPNDDGFNDILYIQAGAEVARIKSFAVFNRWGESMIELGDFLPNDPAYGWNGKHRGQLMNAAVFVYFAEVEFIDGETRLFKGDVTLMR